MPRGRPTCGATASCCRSATPRTSMTLGEGMTPLLPLPRLGAALGVPRLLMKDEGLIPTGIVQGARRGGRRLAGARARDRARGDADERQRRRRVVGLRRARRDAAALVVMPVDAPEITRRECVVAGAELYLVDGLISDAGAIVAGAVADGDWLSGRLDAQGALPHRGQEDDGLRDRRAARLAGARRDPLPDRRRGRPDRHPQGAAASCASSAGSTARCRGSSPCRRPAARRSCARSSAALARRAVRGRPHRRVRHQRRQGARRLPGARRDRATPAAARSRSSDESCSPRSPRRPASRARSSAPRARPASPRSGACASPAGSPRATRSCCSTPAPGSSTRDTVAADPPVLRPRRRASRTDADRAARGKTPARAN